MAAVASTTYGGSDGKITGTTTAMEYKLSTASGYTAVAGTEITGLEAGNYNIRYAAKSGFNAGTVIDVEVPSGSNANQGPPIGLAAVVPTTYGGSDGKITGTIPEMEYKLSTASDYTAVTGTEITGLEAGTYNIRYAAKSGFNAGTVIDVEVPSGSNANQGPPIGLAAVAPITYGGSDGKITGTTTAMEYKLSTDSDYTAVAGTEITGLEARTYNIRYAAKSGFNAGTSNRCRSTIWIKCEPRTTNRISCSSTNYIWWK